MRLPLGHIEKIGRCTIVKKRDYGYKYHVYVGNSFYQFGSIGRARAFALQDYARYAHV